MRIDGYTIDVDGARFRLVGLDTPETYRRGVIMSWLLAELPRRGWLALGVTPEGEREVLGLWIAQPREPNSGCRS